MAQAAWSWPRPSLRLSSWSCMGPRHRATAARTNLNDGEYSAESSCTKTQTSEPLLTSPQKTTSACETTELPMSSSEGINIVWNSEIECSCSDEMALHGDVDADLPVGEDPTDHTRLEDRMTEAELWQQLEHELYDRMEGEEADVAKEIREEEAAAIAEVGESQSGSSLPEMKDVHRFYPPGKIMHIITSVSDEVVCESDQITSSEADRDQLAETMIGIFLTPRSLYSQLRLSQTMVSDHFMPVYRRQIEKLIKELEKEEAYDNDYSNKVEEDIL